MAPDGRFGFHCTTYNGNLPQDNTWSDSWEAFFENGLRHVLKVREERAGLSAELDALLPALFEKVIPRLLRPLESNDRKVQPSLVHGDLWCGNVAVDSSTGYPIVFDPASFYAHNECKLAARLRISRIGGLGCGRVDEVESQTSLATGARSETGSRRGATSRLIKPTLGSLRSPQKTSTTGTLYTLCMDSIIVAITISEKSQNPNSVTNRRFDLHAATLFPDRGEFLEM